MIRIKFQLESLHFGQRLELFNDISNQANQIAFRLIEFHLLVLNFFQIQDIVDQTQ
ncbi:hypothetical protein D3C87_1911030 [compost metagenome]